MKKVRQNVEYLLRTFPKTRDSDSLLILQYIRFFRGYLIGIDVNGYDCIRLCDFEQTGIGNEGITRARRWLQAHYPELGASEGVKNRRYINQKEMEINSLNGNL